MSSGRGRRRGDGDAEIQQAVRFGLFHILQAAARAEFRPIAAKGLTGPGYDGHTFWDTETFVLPVLTYTQPSAAADVLRWRHIGAAGPRAARPTSASTGPRSRGGRSRPGVLGYWPAGTAAFHINADIADAVSRYMDATGTRSSSVRSALRCWWRPRGCGAALGHHDAEGRFRIDGVTGPDEYSAVKDNNVFTNLMAQRNMWAPPTWPRSPRTSRGARTSTTEETAAWRDAANAM
jgi:alpha,alpha-trehalose phosphorylase